MNIVIIEIKDCKDCQFCDHNGLLQTHPKYCCHNKKLYDSKLMGGRKKYNTKNGIDYWYGLPILADYHKIGEKPISVPDWCPLKKKGEQ